MEKILESLKEAFYNIDKDAWDLNTELLLQELKKTKPEEFKKDEDLRKLDALSVVASKVVSKKEGRLSFVDWSFKFPFFLEVDLESEIIFCSSKFYAKSEFFFSETWTPNFRNTKFLDTTSFRPHSKDSKLLNADFRGSIFKNGCNFVNVLFAAEAKFSKCTFESLDQVEGIYDRNLLSRFRGDEAVFLRSTFEESANFRECTFNVVADFREVIFTKGVVFYYSRFLNLGDFQKAEFGNKDTASISIASFRQTEFEGKVNFEETIFLNNTLADFSGAKFTGSVVLFTQNFYWRSFNLFSLRQERSLWSWDRGRSLTEEDVAKVNEQYQVSRKSIIDDYYKRKKYKSVGGLKEIRVDRAIFECLAIFDLKFKSCPDFSKTHFLKDVFIEETWSEIDDKKIKPKDVEKFRFFKNYFKENGNHFKENEYFSYEMKAVEKAKRCELNLLQGKGFFNCQRWGKRFALSRWKLRYERFAQKVRGFFNCQRWKKRLAISRWNLRWERLAQEAKRLFNGQRWKKRLSCGRWQLRWARLCKRMDFWLFKIYRIVSDYGMSVSRPFVSILVSIVFFSFVFSCHFQKEFIKKPSEKSLAFYNFSTTNHLEQNSVILSEAKNLVNLKLPSQTHEILRFSQNDGFGDDKNNTENDKNAEDDKASLGQIAAKTFLLTINPFGVFKFLESSSNAWFIFIVGIQSLLNTALLFLLALGIRNRFKVK